MYLAAIADTHSRLDQIPKALNLFASFKVTHVIHCGDIADAAAVRLFKDFHTHFVFGNCDTDRKTLRAAISEIGATCCEDFGQLEIEDKKIAFLHGDDASRLRRESSSGAHDYLFHGHSHHAGHHRLGPTLILNPGALHRATRHTIAILDLATGQFEILPIGQQPI